MRIGKKIINRNWDSVYLFRIRCYKNLHRDKFKNMEQKVNDKCMEWISNAICSAKEWRLHQQGIKGISPASAFEYEQHLKSRSLTKVVIGVSIITLIAVIIFSAAQLKGCQW